MAKKTVKLPNNQTVEGESVGFKAETEPWYEYQCEDGTTLRVKLVVSEIVRLDGVYTPEGDPVYTIKSQNVVSAQVPEGLRKEEGEGGTTSDSGQGHYV